MIVLIIKMTYNPLYRILVQRINNILERIGIISVIEFSGNNIKIQSLDYKIIDLQLKNICPKIADDPTEFYYYLFSTTWKNIFKVDKSIHKCKIMTIKSLYFYHVAQSYKYSQWEYIDNFKINILLGRIGNSYVDKTLTILYSRIIDYFILINRISYEYLVNDIRITLYNFITVLLLSA